MINIREEIEHFVEENFQVEFESDEFPISKFDLIDILTEKFQELNEQLKKEQLVESLKNRFHTYRLN